MARALRIQFENVYDHAPGRGNAHQEVLAKDKDQPIFFDLLERPSDFHQTDILASVLRSDHFDLLVKTALPNLQEFMRHFHTSSDKE